MKRNFSKHLKLGILSLGIIFSFFSCQKDDIQNHNIVQHSNLPLKMDFVTSKHIQENEMLSLQLKKYQSNKEDFLNREIYNSEYDFTIDTDYAKYMESQDGNFHSYTFAIIQDSTELVLKNLVLYSYNSIDYQATLVKYHLNENQIQELKLNDHISTGFQVEVENIEGDFSNVLAREGEPCDFEVTVYHITPDTGETFEYSEGSTCQHINPVTGETECEVHTVIVIDCPSTGGGSSSSNGTTNTGNEGYSWTWGYGTGGYSGGNSTGNNNTNGNNAGTVLGTSPIIRGHITALTNQTNNIQIKNRIQQMEEDINSIEQEQGSEFRRIANDGTIGTNVYTEYQVPNSDRGFDYVKYPNAQSNSEVRLHVHHENTQINIDGNEEKLAPVFSIDDVFGMSEFYEQKIDAISGILSSQDINISSILVSSRGLYALSVIDSQKTLEFHDYLTNDATNDNGQTYKEVVAEGFINEVINKTIEQCGNCNDEIEDSLFELNFINFFNKLDTGLGLFVSYEIDENGNYIWTFLTN